MIRSPGSTWSSRKPRSSKIGFQNTPKGAGRKATRLFFSAIADEKRRSRFRGGVFVPGADRRSEEHTSELQSLMRSSYAVFCLKKKTETETSHLHTINRIYTSRLFNNNTNQTIRVS